MTTTQRDKNSPPPAPRRLRKWLRRLLWTLATSIAFCFALIFVLFAFLNRVPQSYPPPAKIIEPPTRDAYARFKLDGFDSPYLGHTGSWNGKGGTMFGGTKENDMDKEVAMGLRWTFMPVNWRALEPIGPVDLAHEIPAAWKGLDAFVEAAQRRKLNILFQAPVIGGNAEGPPDWAGRREPDKSAPTNMDAAADFATKLARRYKPGGTLAVEQGWGDLYGVRAWEIDNEPEMYRTHWKNQAADYAELATKVAAKIKAEDPLAMIILPGVASGKHKFQWLEQTLHAEALAGSPTFKSNAIPYSIGPIADAVSFHVYEGLDSAFAGQPRTVEVVFDELREIFEVSENRSAEFLYARKQEYWHTEGNFDFIGALSKERRAAWRIQFFTRAFAAGVRKVCVMDASKPEIRAVRAYIDALPWPFPMHRADEAIQAINPSSKPIAYRHLDSSDPQGGQVWIIWTPPGQVDSIIKVPVHRSSVTIIKSDGSKNTQTANDGQVEVRIKADQKMVEPVLVVDR
ncbi:MAG TPA: hypothetical protein VF773_11370 [Verrucomicrobiae bacterium]